MTATDTPERDAETVALFVQESLEGLQRVEQLLLDAERGAPATDLMSTIFRDVHTIKGTSGFLAFASIQSLSHVAEDLLSRLRSKELTPCAEHYTLLLAVGDRLRQLVQNVQHTNEEGDFEVESLITKLQVLLSNAEAPKEKVIAAVADHREEAASKEALKADGADGTVRVNVAVLDRLMNLIGELVLARNQLVQMVRQSSDSTVNAQAACQRLNLVTSDLQEQIMKTRMQPVARVFEKIPRMVRDLAKTTHKELTTQIEGTTTEIDKALVEAVRDPVMHIVRNAIDHGIELPEERIRAGKPAAGKLFVRASHEGGMVTIEIEDDGRGMDPNKLRAHAIKKQIISAADAERLSDREALDLVFKPGFSTAEKVTDISGRGVGMDVVRTHVERAGGQAEIDSIVGQGTVIRLKMPLTLAIIPALLVRSGGQRFAIPQVNLLELVYLNEDQSKSAIEHVRGAAILRLRGEVLPIVRLGAVLGCESEVPADTTIVVLAVGPQRYGLVVEAIQDTEEIVIKPLHGQLKRLSCYSGATVLGDGGVALILDVAGVATKAGIDMSVQRKSLAAAVHDVGQRKQAYVVFRSGSGGQCAVPLAMVARLEKIASSTIERVAGEEVVQYRGTILPIVRPEHLMPLGERSEQAEQPLVVFDFGQRVAMAVNEILDVVELEVSRPALGQETPYALGQAVVFGRTTLILDAHRIAQPGLQQRSLS